MQILGTNFSHLRDVEIDKQNELKLARIIP